MGREVTERFGEGPHHVRFDMFFNNTESSFVVQTVPLDIMPHTVHLFLEQVYHKLWDGCTFLINQRHRIQAGPFRDFSLKDRTLEERFKSLELDSVSFQEFNKTYSHEKWSLAYSGRPGGPDFYINLADDNNHLYGPGGMQKHVLDEEGDPVFTKVTAGFDVIENIAKQPLRKPGHFILNPVVITRATLLHVEPGNYRHTFYEDGYYGFHDHDYYIKEETKDVELNA